MHKKSCLFILTQQIGSYNKIGYNAHTHMLTHDEDSQGESCLCVRGEGHEEGEDNIRGPGVCTTDRRELQNRNNSQLEGERERATDSGGTAADTPFSLHAAREGGRPCARQRRLHADRTQPQRRGSRAAPVPLPARDVPR